MATQNSIEQQLLDTLATKNFDVERRSATGDPTNDVDDAKTFTFDYVSGTGKNYGTMVIVMDVDNDMKCMYGDNLGRTMEGDNKNEFFDFLEHLGLLARRNRWTRTIQDISQLKHTMQGLAAIKEGLFEGYYGNRVVSYSGEPTEARLMIKHSQKLGETDARYRFVENIFIETADGERFKLESKSLSAARAMLEHVRQGGKPYDIRGCHITEMIKEIGVLSRFNRASGRRVMEGSTQQLAEQAKIYYKQLRENIKHLASPRGYNAYFETWHPATITEQDELVEDIKNLFIEQHIDSRIEEALPLLARLQKQGQDMKEIQMFESWISNLGEGTWALPDTPETQQKLNDLMSKELIVGPDAVNATEQLYDVVGDDELFDILSDLAERSNGRANVWDDTDVQKRFKQLGIQLNTTSSAEQQPAPTPPAGGAPGAATPPMMESILDEDGETLQHVLDRFKNEVKRFRNGEDLDDDLYYALFDYYSDNGEMPYGVTKARDADPRQWVAQQLSKKLGIDEGDNMATFEASGCNMTREGEYCPEHGLMECGMMEMGTVAGGVATVMGEQGTAEGMLGNPGQQDSPAAQAFQAQRSGMQEANDDPINYNAAITGSYYEAKEDPLARMKSLALRK